MAEFIQSYGIWIVLGFLFLLMMRGHAHGGGGCCGGGHQQDQQSSLETEKGKADIGRSDRRSSGYH